MAAPLRGTPVGVRYAQYGLVGTNGFGYGTVGESAAVNTTMSAKLLRYPKNATLPQPQRVITPITGGDRFLGQVMFGPNDFGSFPLVLANWDAEFSALATASVADQTTNSRWTRTSDNLDETDLPQMFLILATLFQSRDDDSDGVNYWANWIIPRCQIAPQNPGAQYQAAAEVTYTVTPTYSKYEPTGLPLSGTGMGLANDRALATCIITNKPLALTNYLANGVATTFVLGFRPAYATPLTVNATPNEMIKNGTPTALSAVNTSSGQVTLAAAGSSGDKIGVFYETDFVGI